MSLKHLYLDADYRDNSGMLLNDDMLSILPQIDDKSIDLIVTDPPYRTTSRGDGGNSGGMLRKDIIKKGQMFVHNNINIKDYASELYRVLKDESHCYIMTNHKNLMEMLNIMTRVGFHFIKSLIWDKGNKIMGQYYMSQFEYILFFRKGKGVKIRNCGTSDILAIPNKKSKGEDGKNLHDTEKPIELMKILIENSTNKGDIVLDPFVGIGTTAIACKELNRRYIGVELDKKYFETARNRVEQIQRKGESEEE